MPLTGGFVLCTAALAVAAVASLKAPEEGSTDDVTATIHMSKERSVTCKKVACTLVTAEELNALVNAAQELEREKLGRRLDSNGCLQGKT